MQRENPRGDRRRWLWWVGTLLVLCILVRALLPEATRRSVETIGGALAGRPITVEDVDLEVLAGRAHLLGIRIGAPPPAGPAPDGAPEPIVSVDSVVTDVDWLRLLALEVSFGRIDVAAPRLRTPVGPDGWPTPLVLQDRRPEWIRPWIARLEPWIRAFHAPVHVRHLDVRDTSIEITTERGPVRGGFDAAVGSVAANGLRFEAGRVEVKTIEISNAHGAVDVTGVGADDDEPAPPTYPTIALVEEILSVPGDRIDEVSVRDASIELRRGGQTLDARAEARLRDVAYAPDHAIALEADIALGDGSVRAEGRATPYPPSYVGALRWQELDVAALATFADLALPIDLERGGSDGDMQADLSVDLDTAVATFELEGEAAVREIAVRGENDSFEASVLRVHVDARRLTGTVEGTTGELGPLEADFERVQVEQPKARLDVPVLNLAQIDVSDWIPDDIEELLVDARMSVSELEIDDGAVDAHDSSVDPPMHTELSDVEVVMIAFRWPELDAERIRFAAQEAGGGGFDLVGSLQGGVGEMSGVISQMPLPGFSGYAIEISGFQIVEGKTSLDTSLAVDADAATLQGNLTLHRLDIEAEEGLFANVFGPPLEVGLALLSDDEGNITVPVVLDYEYGTELSLWTIAWASLKAALQGGIGSSLEGVAGPDGKIPPLPFPTGEAVVPDGSDERLARLAAALKRHPDLRLTFVGHTGPADLPEAAAEARTALATRRATALRDRLTESHGADPQRVTARAGQESEPSATLELSLPTER